MILNPILRKLCCFCMRIYTKNEPQPKIRVGTFHEHIWMLYSHPHRNGLLFSCRRWLATSFIQKTHTRQPESCNRAINPNIHGTRSLVEHIVEHTRIYSTARAHYICNRTKHGRQQKNGMCLFPVLFCVWQDELVNSREHRAGSIRKPFGDLHTRIPITETHHHPSHESEEVKHAMNLSYYSKHTPSQL